MKGGLNTFEDLNISWGNMYLRSDIIAKPGFNRMCCVELQNRLHLFYSQ